MSPTNARNDHTAPIALAIHGAKGRMGQRIAALAADMPGVRVTALLDRDSDRQTSVSPKLAETRAIIDFSSDEGTRAAADLAQELGAALLVGTTALSPTTLDRLAALERSVPVMVCANTSLGVAVARHLAREAARLLGADYSIDIIETHHTKKLDAPSGTALALAASVAEGGRTVAPDRIHAIRAGDVIGDHIVQFAGVGELLRIQHSATTRDLFARGALRAASWLPGKPAGRYRIEDTFA